MTGSGGRGAGRWSELLEGKARLLEGDAGLEMVKGWRKMGIQLMKRYCEKSRQG